MSEELIGVLALLTPVLAAAAAGSAAAVGRALQDPQADYGLDEKQAFRRRFTRLSAQLPPALLPGHRASVVGGEGLEPLRLVMVALEGSRAVTICAELVLQPDRWRLRVFPDRFTPTTRALAREAGPPERRGSGQLRFAGDTLVVDLDPEELDAEAAFDVLYGGMLAAGPGRGPSASAVAPGQGAPIGVPL